MSFLDECYYSEATLCNIFLVHGFRQSVYDVEEGNRLDTEFTLNVVGTTQLRALDISGTITAEAHGTSSRQDIK